MQSQKILEKFIRLWNGISNDNLNFIAAGIAFYFLLASFPALAAAISLYGLFSDPQIISDQIDMLDRILPADVISIFKSQVTGLLESSDHSLGLGFALSILIAIYSATRGVAALIKGLNIVYKEKEQRNYFVRIMTGYALTFILLAYMLIALGLIAGMPALFALSSITEAHAQTLLLFRWPLLFFTALIGLETVYLFGPSHSKPRWHWISWGSVLATTLWLIMSNFFSMFVMHFGNYNETYGSISAIVILLLWFWLSALTILLGAEINESFQEPRQKQRHFKPNKEPSYDGF